MSIVRPIPKAKFQIYGFAKLPTTAFFSEEKEWFSDDRENVLGAVILDKPDQDWGYVILGRDLDGVFKCIDLNVSLPTIGRARNELFIQMEKFHSSNSATFPQGTGNRKKNEIFRQIIPNQKLNSHFKVLAESEGYSPAREVIKELVYTFQDPDGNYIEQFQSSGFNSRLWELYLYAFFTEQGFSINRSFPVPDYVVDKFGFKLCVEATTVNPTEGEIGQQNEAPPGSIEEKLKDYVPIKFGSALYSKYKKKYWELTHVADHPFLLAIQDFHTENSMIWSQSGLITYLYGLDFQAEEKADGTIRHKAEKIEKHCWGGKEIPSGFFLLPESENISGVLFSNSATLSKFNRMGKLAEFGSPRVKMIRKGIQYDWDPSALQPKPFTKMVQAGLYDECWSEGAQLFHNPNSKFPIPKEVFSNIAHHYPEGEKLKTLYPNDFFPIASETYILTTYETSS